MKKKTSFLRPSQSGARRVLAMLVSLCMVLGTGFSGAAVFAEKDASSAVSSDASGAADDAQSGESSDGETKPPAANASGAAAAVIADAKPDFKIHSKAVYMVNTDTGVPIKVYAKNETERRSPASLTKIMTAILAIEHMKSKKDVVKVPGYIYDEFVGKSVSHADIRRGEEITVEDLLYALMLKSGCEAGSALAHYVCPDNIPAFVDMMNQKAKEIGCTDTHFVNAHGLDEEGQYTTAYDMFLITDYAMKNETFAKIACSPTYEMRATNVHKEKRKIWHTNYMLSSYYGGGSYYEYVRGIKTGTTDNAGRNLVTAGEKDGFHYLLVTLGAPMYDGDGNLYKENYSYTDHRNLYNWAFDTFRFTTVIEEYQSLDEVPVRFGSDADHVTVTARSKVVMLLPKTLDVSTILVSTHLPKALDAPVVKGDKAGTVDLQLAGETVTSVDLIAESDVARSGFAYSLHLIRVFFTNPLVIVAVVVLALLIGTLMVFVIKERKQRKREPAPQIRQIQDRAPEQTQ